MNEQKHKPKIEKLSAHHRLSNFESGQLELDNYLQKYVLVNQQANSAQTYVAIYNDEVIGYYSLVVGSVSHQEAPHRIKKGQAQHPIPVLILARLAVTKTWQKQGIGKGLLKDALHRTAQAANLVGIRALLVHAKNETAKKWYEKFDFTPSPTDDTPSTPSKSKDSPDASTASSPLPLINPNIPSTSSKSSFKQTSASTNASSPKPFST